MGAGTPISESMWGYWHLIGIASQLMGKTYTKMIRLVGEDSVLYL
jgi:hypothetical protein